MVLETLPGVGGEANGGGNTIGRQVRHGGIVRFAIVLDDLLLARDAEVLAVEASVGHDDERDMAVRQGRLVLAVAQES